MGRKVRQAFFAVGEDGAERLVAAGTVLADDDPAVAHEVFLHPDAAAAQQLARDAAASGDHRGAQITQAVAETAPRRRRA